MHKFVEFVYQYFGQYPTIVGVICYQKLSTLWQTRNLAPVSSRLIKRFPLFHSWYRGFVVLVTCRYAELKKNYDKRFSSVINSL